MSTDLVPYWSARALWWRYGVASWPFSFWVDLDEVRWGFSFEVPTNHLAQQLAMALPITLSLPLALRFLLGWFFVQGVVSGVTFGVFAACLTFLVVVWLVGIALSIVEWFCFGLVDFGATACCSLSVWFPMVLRGAWGTLIYLSPTVWFWWFLKTTVLLAWSLPMRSFGCRGM